MLFKKYLKKKKKKTWTGGKLKKLVNRYIAQSRLPRPHKPSLRGNGKQLSCLLQKTASHFLPTGGLLFFGPILSGHIMFIPEAAAAAASVECLPSVRIHSPTMWKCGWTACHMLVTDIPLESSKGFQQTLLLHVSLSCRETCLSYWSNGREARRWNST